MESFCQSPTVGTQTLELPIFPLLLGFDLGGGGYPKPTRGKALPAVAQGRHSIFLPLPSWQLERETNCMTWSKLLKQWFVFSSTTRVRLSGK